MLGLIFAHVPGTNPLTSGVLFSSQSKKGLTFDVESLFCISSVNLQAHQLVVFCWIRSVINFFFIVEAITICIGQQRICPDFYLLQIG